MNKRTLSRSQTLSEIDQLGRADPCHTSKSILNREVDLEHFLPQALHTTRMFLQIDLTKGGTLDAVRPIREEKLRKILQTERRSIPASTAEGRRYSLRHEGVA